MPVQNARIAAMFDQAADLLEIQGENQFRVRAYRRAARTIEGLPQSIRSLLLGGTDLSELPGIGKDLAGKIADIVKSGHFKLLDSLKKKLPGDLGEIAGLPGLGPKRVKLLYEKLKVRTLNDLRCVIKAGRLQELRGFDPTIEKKLSGALENSIRILREYGRGVVFMLGRFWKVKGPGLVIVVPFIQQMVRVDLRTRVLNVPPQDVISRDNVSVQVNAVIYCRVMDPEKAIIQVEHYNIAISELAHTTLRSVVGQHELDEMLAERTKINADVQRILDEQTGAWGRTRTTFAAASPRWHS